MPSRRHFLHTSAAILSAPFVRAASPSPVLGHGDWKYRVVPGWGVLDDKTPVNDCHGIVIDAEGHIILLTNEAKNNVIIYSPEGRLVSKWGTTFPGAHGLSIVTEGKRQVLFITDLKTSRVAKTTLDGQILQEWTWPQASGKYAKQAEYKPSWTLHLSNGDFFILDGYGKDYIQHIGADGKQKAHFGGAEGGIVHWGPHGGMAEETPGTEPSLLIAMSDQQHLLRLSTSGQKISQHPLPGGNPRQIRKHGDLYFVAHLADNWPADRQSRGFISVLDKNLRVISNIAGTTPTYTDQGALQKMSHATDTFMHPHDLVVSPTDHSLYVAQFSSGKTYPIKLERV